MRNDLTDWVSAYPTDYRKIIGDMFITKLEYRVLMHHLTDHRFFELIPFLERRKETLYENTDAYLNNPAVYSITTCNDYKVYATYKILLKQLITFGMKELAQKLLSHHQMINDGPPGHIIREELSRIVASGTAQKLWPDLRLSEELTD